MQLRGGKTWALEPATDASVPARRIDPVLLEALRRAHRLADGSADSAPISIYERKLVRLAFLAPDLQRAIVEGRQPAELTLAVLMRAELPVLWDEQRMWMRETVTQAAGPL